MAVSALISDALLLTTNAPTVAANNTSATPTEVAFSLPNETQYRPAITDDHDEQPQNTADNQHGVDSDDSSNEVLDTAAVLSITPPAFETDQLLSQQLTPLQLTLGQTLVENTAKAQDTALSALPTTEISVPQTDINTDTSATDTDSTTALLQATSTDGTYLLPLNGTGKINASFGKNTTATNTENNRTTSSSDNSSQSLNISVLTLPAMASAPSNNSNTSTLTTTESDVDYSFLSTSAVPPATHSSVMTNTIGNDNRSNWFGASTTTSLASTTSNGNSTVFSGKLTGNTNSTTSQSLTQIFSEFSLFADSSAALSTTPNTPQPSTSTTSTTQQLGEQLLDTLKQQVSTQLSQKTQQATIRLDPPSLGQLDISIRIDGDKMTVQINAEHSGVRESLQNSREQLRQLLSTEHSGTVDVDIGQQQSSTPQQRQSSYALITDLDIISAAVITNDTTVTSVSSEPATTGDWLNTVV